VINNILIVGGYGHVGQIISTRLAEYFPGRVIAAGRSYQKAKTYAQGSGHKLLPLELDIFSAESYKQFLDDIAVVVMCIDQRDTEFIKACMRRGIDYIDITATYKFLSKVESLDVEARKLGTTAVLSVGLAPGLTNLLAAHAKAQLATIQQVDIFILLGSGEAAGSASIRWILDNMGAEYYVQEQGVERLAGSFIESKQTYFPNIKGKRTAYRFNFSDQHVIPKTLKIETVSTWLCFESPFMTALFAFMRKSGLGNILRFKPIYEAFVRLFQTVQIGSDEFTIKVEAKGKSPFSGQQDTYVAAISGREEGRCTGEVAAEVARRLYTGSFEPGVFHIEQLFEPFEFVGALEDYGVKLSLPQLH
jgi:saccharopine dehydrogenase-like NADP-dependent oxidoreductase